MSEIPSNGHERRKICLLCLSLSCEHIGMVVSLSGRDRDLIGFLTRGFSNRVIAETIAVSEGTVKVYLHKLFTKLGLKSRHEVCAWGFAHRDLWEGEVPQLSAKEDQDA